MKCPHCGLEINQVSTNIVPVVTAMLAKGMSGKEAAKELGLKPEQLSRLMIQAGSPIMSLKERRGTRPGASNQERTKRIMSLRLDDGLTYVQIGERVGLSAQRVSQIINAQIDD